MQPNRSKSLTIFNQSNKRNGKIAAGTVILFRC
jgi:hypothetical protein